MSTKINLDAINSSFLLYGEGLLHAYDVSKDSIVMLRDV
jgi:hypothetical protein